MFSKTDSDFFETLPLHAENIQELIIYPQCLMGCTRIYRTVPHKPCHEFRRTPRRFSLRRRTSCRLRGLLEAHAEQTAEKTEGC